MLDNDWVEHKIYVLKNLEELKQDTKDIKKDLSTLGAAFEIFRTKILTYAASISTFASIVVTIIGLFIGK